MFALLAQAAWESQPEIPVGFQGDAVAYSLLLLLAAVIVLGAICLLFTLHFLAQRRGEMPVTEAPAAERPDASVAWRNNGVLLVPARWMAVRATTVREVRNALRLSRATPCSIEDGLAGNHQQALFLAPPVNGWVLITGPGVPDPAIDIDEVYHLLRALSIKLGSAQFFGFNRGLGHHGWAWARGGGVVRAFAWVDGTVWNEGVPTPAEQSLRMRCPTYDDPAPRSAMARQGILTNIDKVPLLAARWSIDPVSVHQQLPNGIGVSGEFTRVRSS
ncbi:MAG: hypothetical protein KF833_22070 [Verrucomicrobiae bacterium]|nr:hypothetical protein [Verrucomicrobiae bacterium]